jgi:predicted 3-demethylubiquinone-9 3-methyltransferase (glyoxalase superfamily)
MQKIIPHLWFDTQAKEAAEFYASAFPDSKVTSMRSIRGTPSGDADIVTFDIAGYSFMAISAGPYFTINPSISFILNFDPSRDEKAEEHLNELWEKLFDGGTALMPLDAYPFSKLYGWLKDRYGVSWQLMLTDPEGEPRPFVIPSLLFSKQWNGKAEEATDFYLSVFKDSKRGMLATYPPGQAPDADAKVMFTDFQLLSQWFAAMDGGNVHDFSFNEGISLVVKCDSQEEIDYYWEKLSAAPESEQCGWLKDKYGVSWQIVPARMDEMMRDGTDEQRERVTKSFLQMKKFDIAALERAYEGGK